MAKYTRTNAFPVGLPADGGKVEYELDALGTSVNNIAAAQVSQDNFFPWYVVIDGAMPSQSDTAAVTINVATTGVSNNLWGTSGQTGSRTWPIVLSAGTWRIDVIYYVSTDRGIVTFNLDGASVGTVDTYAAFTATPQAGQIANITVSTSGKHVLNITTATKNASSSGYATRLSNLQLIRTA